MPDRTPTPALGVELLAATRGAGGAEPYADLLNEVAFRAAQRARPKIDPAKWLSIVCMLMASVLAVSLWIYSRPSEAQVDQKISDTRQHPESKAGIAKNAAELQLQKIQLTEISGGIKAVNDTLVEIKGELKELRKK